jgi:hypothetical protein
MNHFQQRKQKNQATYFFHFEVNLES